MREWCAYLIQMITLNIKSPSVIMLLGRARRFLLLGRFGVEVLLVLSDLFATQLDLEHLVKEAVHVTLVEFVVVLQLLDQILNIFPFFEALLFPLEDLQGHAVEYLLA